MATYLIANTTDALGGENWAFDASNFLVGPVNTGINVGAPANPDQPNSVNVESALDVNGTSVDTLFLPLANPTTTGTATFVTLTTGTANVTTCQAAHYELKGLDIKAARAFSSAIALIPSGYQPPIEVSIEFTGLNQTITPQVTGLVYVLMSGMISMTAGQTGHAIPYCGTGTPPTQGQQLLNTPNYTQLGPGNIFTSEPSPAAQKAPFTNFVAFQGTVGTTYWIDVIAAFETIISDVNLYLVEV